MCFLWRCCATAQHTWCSVNLPGSQQCCQPALGQLPATSTRHTLATKTVQGMAATALTLGGKCQLLPLLPIQRFPASK